MNIHNFSYIQKYMRRSWEIYTNLQKLQKFQAALKASKSIIKLSLVAERFHKAVDFNFFIWMQPAKLSHLL